MMLAYNFKMWLLIVTPLVRMSLDHRPNKAHVNRKHDPTRACHRPYVTSTCFTANKHNINMESSLRQCAGQRCPTKMAIVFSKRDFKC